MNTKPNKPISLKSLQAIFQNMGFMDVIREFNEEIKSFIRSQDFFGHTITLNFDRAGDTHNTTIGGFVSCFIRAFITVYVMLNIKKMFLYESDAIQKTESFLNLTELGKIKFQETNVTVFFVLNNNNYKDARLAWAEEKKKVERLEMIKNGTLKPFDCTENEEPPKGKYCKEPYVCKKDEEPPEDKYCVTQEWLDRDNLAKQKDDDGGEKNPIFLKENINRYVDINFNFMKEDWLNR